MGAYRIRGRLTEDRNWDAERIRDLRRYLQLTQLGLSLELNIRQQTVSEWETGRYRPRGSSARLLTLIAEEAAFSYRVSGAPGASAPEDGVRRGPENLPETPHEQA